MLLEHPAAGDFPLAVADGEIDVRFVFRRAVHILALLGDEEIHRRRGTLGEVCVHGDANAVVDARIENLLFPATALAGKALVVPLHHDRLEIAEEARLVHERILMVEIGDDRLGKLRDDAGGAFVRKPLPDVHVSAGARDAAGNRLAGTEVLGLERKPGIRGECGAALPELDRALEPVSANTGKPDFEFIAVRADGLYALHFRGLDRPGGDAFGDEVEGHPEDVGVLWCEEAGRRILRVALAPQGAAHDLLAEQLRAEGAHAEDVRDVEPFPKSETRRVSPLS